MTERRWPEPLVDAEYDLLQHLSNRLNMNWRKLAKKED